MGFGAVAALAGTAISAGVSAAGSAGLFGGGGPNLGDYSSTLNKLANQYITPYANNPNAFQLNVPGAVSESMQFGFQNAPQVNQFDMQQLQNLLNQALPGYQGMVSNLSTNAASLLSGQVPYDVQQQIQRGSAQAMLTSGVGGVSGPGAGLTRNAGTARSLGLTSLGLEQQGASQTGNLLQLSRNYLMPQPINPMSLLPASDLIAAQQWTDTAQYQANLAAYNAKAAAAAARVGAPSPNALAGIGGALSGLNQNLSAINPQTGQSGYNLIGSWFGGGGGSNPSNPSFNMDYANALAQSQGYSSYYAGEAAGAI